MQAFGVVNYLTYVLGVILIILLPGPNSLYVLALSAQQGAQKSWAAAMGVFIGDAVLMLLTAFGAATVLNAYPAVFNSIKFLGAAYLLYIGSRLIYNAWSNWRHHGESNIDNMQRMKPFTVRQAFVKALLVSLLNPKAILFFLSFFVQFVDANYANPMTPFLILGFTLQFFSFCYLSMLIYVGARLADAFRHRPVIRHISAGGIGMVFLGFAGKLALATVSS